MQRKSWTQQEDLALQAIVEEIGLDNWTLVSAKLSHQVVGSLRTGKQCRQRWKNHLDLQVSKRQWTKNEEKILFQIHNLHGNRWKEIGSVLKTRTENDIKNHFYATIRKGIRRLNRFLGLVKDPLKIRKIKPAVMSKLLQQESNPDSLNSKNKQANGLFDLLIKLSRCDPKLEEYQQYFDSQQIVEEGTKFLNKIVEQNEVYNQSRSQSKNVRKRTSSSGVLSQYPNSQPNRTQFDISEYLCLQNQNSQSQNPKSQGHKIQDHQMLQEQEDRHSQKVAKLKKY